MLLLLIDGVHLALNSNIIVAINEETIMKEWLILL